MTVSEIQTEALRLLGFGARTTAANLLPSISEGNIRIYNKLVAVHERLFYATKTFNAISGRQEYTVADGVPSDIKHILKLETRYTDQTMRVRAVKIKFDNIDQMEKATTTYHSKEHPGYYWMDNGANTVIGFDPAHDINGQDYTKIWYLKKPTAITDGSQTPIIPDDAHYLLINFAVAKAQLSEDEDSQTYLLFLRQWEKDVDSYVESELPGVLEQQFAQEPDNEPSLW